MAASSAFVVGNSLRLRRFGTSGTSAPRTAEPARDEDPGQAAAGEQVTSCPG
jgi:hypothetical protein